LRIKALIFTALSFLAVIGPLDAQATEYRGFSLMVEQGGNGDYTIRFKSDVNSARPYKQGTPFIKASLFDDDPFTSIHELVNTLTAKPNEVIQ
jgi:hypothetical protein